MIIYADLSSGASGDKILGALLEINDQLDVMPFSKIEEFVQACIPQTRISRSRVSRNGIAATHIDVVDAAPQPHRHWSDIRTLIESAPLADGARQRALKAFSLIAEAEARVHGIAVDKIHFHEVGACDSIVDVVCTSMLLDALDVTSFFATPIALGSGTIECEHGILPVPAPATSLIVEGLPVYAGIVQTELTTPTGAALIAANATSFEPLPLCRVRATGNGAGSKDFAELPNVVRIIAADADEVIDDGSYIEQVAILESNIDHISPEDAASACSRLMEEGALDVWQTPIVMKKGRLSQTFCVMCRPSQAARFASLIHLLTGTLGVRHRIAERSVFARKQFELDTPYGTVRFKAAHAKADTPDRMLNIRPEHDDVERIAHRQNLPYSVISHELVAFAQARCEASGCDDPASVL